MYTKIKKEAVRLTSANNTTHKFHLHSQSWEADEQKADNFKKAAVIIGVICVLSFLAAVAESSIICLAIGTLGMLIAACCLQGYSAFHHYHEHNTYDTGTYSNSNTRRATFPAYEKNSFSKTESGRRYSTKY